MNKCTSFVYNIRDGDSNRKISGNNGNDFLDGKSGYDKIGGEMEKDELKGGDSQDLFICDKKDHIIDFNIDDKDKKSFCDPVDIDKEKDKDD